MASLVDMATSLTEGQWYYSRDEVSLPPSVRAGMPLHEERGRRANAVKRMWLIRDRSMTFNQPVVTAAATFVHRFYMRETLQDWDHKTTAAAAMFLACKSEEEPRSLKSLVTWLLDPDNTGKPIDPQAATDVRQRILTYEEAMLRVLCFDLTVRHPHWIAVSAARAAWTGAAAEGAKVGDKVAQAAWLFLNDSLSAPLCLLYTPPVLAAAALVLACAQLDVPLPGPPPPLAEQRALHDLAVQEAEEGEETPAFEPQVYWLDMIGVRAEDLREPVKDIVDVYKLANDPFVVDEGARLAPKAIALLDTLPPSAAAAPQVPPASSDSPSAAPLQGAAVQAMDLS